MKTLIVKADRAMLALMTQWVRKWVEKKEHKLHKIDFLIRFEWVQFAGFIVWALVLPAALYVIHGEVMGAVLHAALWSALGVFEWLSIQSTINNRKPAHDYLFKMRENSEYSKIHGEILEEMFEESRGIRLTSTAVLFGITGSLFLFSLLTHIDQANAAVWQYLLVNAIANGVRMYIPYVNDFEPPRKKKKAPASISDMLSQLWQTLIGDFKPVLA